MATRDAGVTAGATRDFRARARRLQEYGRAIRHGLRPRYAVVSMLVRLLPTFSAGPIVARLYRLAGCRIGTGSSIAGPLRLVPGDGTDANLHVGERVVISSDVTINLDGVVAIGDQATIGPRVVIYTSSHSLGPGSRRMSANVVVMPVEIGPGSWVGLGAIILPGVTIGPGTVIAAGSVVTSDVPANSFVEGNPATVKRTLPWGDR